VADVMTIGTLSRRTGIPVKALRAYEDMGLLYTVGRSPGNYRLFGEEALWCVGVVSGPPAGSSSPSAGPSSPTPNLDRP
jgi:hypothetical protein